MMNQSGQEGMQVKSGQPKACRLRVMHYMVGGNQAEGD